MSFLKKYGIFLCSPLLLNEASAALVIQNNFDGVADDIGPGFQQLTNGQGGSGTFIPTTGLVDNFANNTNSTGFNNISLVILDSATTQITATFVVDSAANISAVQSNGFFLGIVTGTDATGTAGSALFNNDPGSLGIQLLQGGVNTNSRIVQDGVDSGTQIIAAGTPFSPTDASIEDGFTFTLVLRDDNTFDASTTGLSTDLNVSNVALTGANPTFNDFLTGGIGLNGSIQGNDAMFTIGSVSLDAVPEPSSTALLGLGGLALLSRRRGA